MTSQNKQIKQNVILTGASAVLLMGLSAFPLAAIASAQFSRQISSQQAIAQSLPSSKKTTTIPQRQIIPLVPPAPEQLQPPSAIVIPTNGRLTVKLVNRTDATLAYQVIGDTQERTLPGRTNVTLQALKTPRTITFYRQDRGLLRVRPQPSPGLLTVTFTETTDLGVDKNVMMIQENGSVYLN